MTNRPCTNYYCPTCGGVVSGWIRHDCSPVVLARIAELEAKDVEWQAVANRYMEELARQTIAHEAHCPYCGAFVKVIHHPTNNSYEFRKTQRQDKEDADCYAELAVFKRALELACVSGRVIEAHPAPQPWRELALEERVAYYLGLARRGLADDTK